PHGRETESMNSRSTTAPTTDEGCRAPQNGPRFDGQNWPVRVLRAPAKNKTPKDERRPGERERQEPKLMRAITPQGQSGEANERSNRCGDAGGFEDAGLEQGAHTASLLRDARQERQKSLLRHVTAQPEPDNRKHPTSIPPLTKTGLLCF